MLKSNNFKKTIIKIFALLFSTQALAGPWNLQALEHFKTYETPGPSFEDPYFFTAFGAAMAFKSELRLWKPKYRNYVKVPVEGFRTGGIEPLLHVERDKADLVIALPGIATSALTPMMARALDAFSNRRMHTAVLYNSWSPSYILQKPNHLPGDLLSEAQVVLKTLKAIVNKIGAENIASIHVYGESYGAFTAAMVAALDHLEGEKIISGGVFMASPPIDFRIAAENLDTLVAKAGSVSKTDVQFKFIRLFWDIFRTKDPTRISSPVFADLQNMISIGVFHNHLETCLKYLRQQVAVPSTVDTFQEYFSYVEKHLRLDRKKPMQYKLSTWLAVLEDYKVPYRIVSTADEFLNQGVEWDAEEISSGHVVVLPSGGHLGFQGLKWWEKLLDIVYRPRDSKAERPSYLSSL